MLAAVPTATYLDRILEVHRARAAADRRSVESLVAAACDLPPTRDFAAALRRPAPAPGRDGGGLAVIAEIKRRSPSKGVLDDRLDPAEVARQYAAGGASCLSVLTDAEFFGGSRADLVAARAAVALPVLRKDFTVAAVDVCEARLMGADAVLLIVAALGDAELVALVELAGRVGLQALVEAHDEVEVDRAVAAGATIIGVNQRDLATFAVDTERAVRVAGSIPADVVAVAESGIRDVADAARLAAAGYQAVLVGETLVRAGDRASAVRALTGHPIGARTEPRTARS